MCWGVFTLPGYWRAAPTAAHLARDQAALAATGCARSSLSALAA